MVYPSEPLLTRKQSEYSLRVAAAVALPSDEAGMSSPAADVTDGTARQPDVSANVTFVSDVHRANASGPMSVTDAGISRLFSDMHHSNADSPMPDAEPSVTEVSFVHI